MKTDIRNLKEALELQAQKVGELLDQTEHELCNSDTDDETTFYYYEDLNSALCSIASDLEDALNEVDGMEDALQHLFS